MRGLVLFADSDQILESVTDFSLMFFWSIIILDESNVSNFKLLDSHQEKKIISAVEFSIFLNILLLDRL